LAHGAQYIVCVSVCPSVRLLPAGLALVICGHVGC